MERNQKWEWSGVVDTLCRPLLLVVDRNQKDDDHRVMRNKKDGASSCKNMVILRIVVCSMQLNWS
jgi:hypothetical protein